MPSIQRPDRTVFERNYMIALLLVASLMVGNQALMQSSLGGLTGDAPRINLAGRQRMLSQRLTKGLLILERGGPRAAGAAGEVSEVLDLWTGSHEQLLRGGLGGRGPAANSPEVARGLDGLDADHAAMARAARQALAIGPGDSARLRQAVDAILEHEAGYLVRMDRLVGVYESEARARVETARRIGWALTGLGVLALGAIGRFLFRPAASLIRRQFLELVRAGDELEGRVRERTRELEQARERHRTLLEQFSHVARTSAAGEMASSLAHELNQPLGAISNYAEGCLIALDSDRPPLDEVREALRRLRETALRGGRIVDRVRRFVTRNAPSREPFAPDRAVRDAAEIVADDASRRGVDLKIDMAPGLPCVLGDPVQIQQVLVNLARNSLDAVMASQTHRPEVVMWTGLAADGEVELGVRDNGEGIPADRIDRIFDAYFSTRADGMGMGLAICRTIVEAHGGRLTVESEPGVRTAFRFRLPPAPIEHEPADRLHRG